MPVAAPRAAVGSRWPEPQGALGGGRTRLGGRAGKCPPGAGKGQTENNLPEAEGRGVAEYLGASSPFYPLILQGGL